jgi:hypothetical protein
MTWGTSVSLANIPGTATDIPRIREGNYSSEFLSKQDGHDIRVTIAHSREKNTGYDRHLIKVSKAVKKTAAEPAHLVEAYFVLRGPDHSAEADVLKVAKDLLSLLTDANIKRAYGWQS